MRVQATLWTRAQTSEVCRARHADLYSEFVPAASRKISATIKPLRERRSQERQAPCAASAPVPHACASGKAECPPCACRACRAEPLSTDPSVRGVHGRAMVCHQVVSCPARRRRTPPRRRNRRIRAPKIQKEFCETYQSYTKILIDIPLSPDRTAASQDSCARQIRGNSRDRRYGHLATCNRVQAREPALAFPHRGQANTCKPCGQVQINTFNPRL